MGKAAATGGRGRRAMGITQRTALFAWLLATFTIVLFAIVVIPTEKQIYLEELESKARSVAVSLGGVTATAAINDDFSTVVEHCRAMLDGDPELAYLVVAKDDGFALIHDRQGWRSVDAADARWLPSERKAMGRIGTIPEGSGRAFGYAQPFAYSGLQWGWIHVGLSVERYDRSLATTYGRITLLALICIILGLVGSVVYAKRLVRPVLALRDVVRVVEQGDLSARADVEGDDEIGGLAGSVNSMTAALAQRNEMSLAVRFAAQQFLSGARWDQVIGEVLARLGVASRVAHVAVAENVTLRGGAAAARLRCEWCAPGERRLGDGPDPRELRWDTLPFAAWAEALAGRGGGVVAAGSATPAERVVLEAMGYQALLLLPILVDGAWWGTLGLMDHDGDRSWSDADRASLRAAADMLGAALARQRAEDEVVAAKEAAEAASLAKSQFLANMSHEIRTPINGVMGMVRLLQRTPLGDNQRRYLANAMASAEALLGVIGDVLDFSKIEAGKLELEEAAFSPADAVDAALVLLVERAEAKGIELAAAVDERVPRQLTGDPDRLKQVLLNLLSNAVKFTSHGTVVVCCVLEGEDAESTTLRFEVRDTGAGIPAEQHKMIFEAFAQADTSMTRAHSGTGLGLSISRELVRLMGGRIGVESVPGRGSTFWFTARFQRAAAPSSAPERRADRVRGMRVLVVDDCAAVRRTLWAILESWEVAAEEAADGASALELLRRAAARGTPFGVALIDAGLDGLALPRRIRQEPALAATALVLMTGYGDAGLADAASDVRLLGTLAKPVRRSEIYNLLVRTAEGDPAPEPAPIAVPPVPWASAPADGATVLVAEDNEINREVAGEMLAALGYRCTFARNGREALEAVQLLAPALVLMDCQMPEVDGYQATALIRRWEEQEATGGGRRRVPIVALTAHAMSGDRARCLAVGMDDYLSKPIDPGQLAGALRRWLGTTAAPPPPPAPAAPSRLGFEGVDEEAVLCRCGGRVELARRLLRKFVEQARADVETLGAALTSAEAGAVAAAAHRLKGSAANVGAEVVRARAADLEQAGRREDLSAAGGLLADLRQALGAMQEKESEPCAAT